MQGILVYTRTRQIVVETILPIQQPPDVIFADLVVTFDVANPKGARIKSPHL